jgi:hypothetical protein
MFWGNFGILRCFAKRFILGELELVFFGVMFGDPRKYIEVGGPLVLLLVFWGNLSVSLGSVSLGYCVGLWSIGVCAARSGMVGRGVYPFT